MSDPVPGKPERFGHTTDDIRRPYIPPEAVEAAKAEFNRMVSMGVSFHGCIMGAVAAVLPVVRQQIADQERRRFWDDLISIRVTTETGEERYYRVEDVTLIRTAAAEVVRGDP